MSLTESRSRTIRGERFELTIDEDTGLPNLVIKPDPSLRYGAEHPIFLTNNDVRDIYRALDRVFGVGAGSKPATEKP